MARREAFATVIDTADKMPDKVGQDGYLYKWDNDLKKYVNSGQRMTALDDPSAVKVFKLAESGTATPTAPKGVGGAADGFKSLVELKDNVLGTGVTDWHDDPQSVSKDYPIQWCAVYGYKNVPISAVGQTEVLFEERYTLTSVILYSTFGAYFTTDGTSITIHNPDGSTVVQPIATPAMVQELQRGLEGVKKQIDGLKESYSGSGAPTLDRSKYPMNKWFEEFGPNLPTDPAIITNIYKAHLDDTYLDSDSLVAYRFIQKPGTPDGAIASYVWEVVGDSAFSKAIADLHKVAGESVKIFATQPTPPYKVGDIWIYDAAKGLSRTCVKAKAEGEAYSATDWLDPYATAAEVNVIRQDLNQAKTDINTAKGNITDLGKAMTDFSGTFGEALKGNIDINAYKQTLPDLQKQLDREQAELSASINRVLASPYLTDQALKNNLQLSKTEVLDAGGKLDQLQKMVDTALSDATLTADEVASIQNLQASYNTAYKLLKERFEACEAFVEVQIPASVQVGGRNFVVVNQIKTGYYIEHSSGDVFPSNPAVHIAIDYISVDSVVYTFNNEKSISQFRYVEYDADKNYIDGKVDTLKTVPFNFVPSTDAKFIRISFRNRDSTEVDLKKIKIEKGNIATDWTPSPEDVQYQIDAINANPPRINPTTKNWEVYKFVDGVGQYVDTGDTSIGDDGKAPEIREGYWWVYNSDIGDWQNSGIKAQGEDGEDALSHTIQVQGELGVRGVAVKDGKLLVTPEIIKEVRGGVNGCVECKLLIYKGGKEVTADAIAKGAAPLWYRVSGGNKVLVQTGGDVFNIDKSWADGVNDLISCTIEDERMSEWGK